MATANSATTVSTINKLGTLFHFTSNPKKYFLVYAFMSLHFS